MNEQTFCFWLQGFVELTESDGGSPHISEKQWLVIKDHLQLVFDKKTPDRNQLDTPSIQRDPLSYKKLSDLIGSDKTFVWPQSPCQITC